MSLITDTGALEALCRRLRQSAFITIDTEFIRDKTYWPRLCLVQAAGDGDAAAIDPLAEGIDLASLLDLLADQAVLKVFHAARQDVEIFYHLMGAIPAPMFDTQVAAMVCGFGDQVAYDVLVSKLTGARIDKASRFTDWSLRPLSNKQLRYALADVTHMRDVYGRLRHRLQATDRESWLQEEMALLTDPATYDADPGKAWQRLKTRNADPRYYAVLLELAAWRERVAQKRDVPRNRILRDDAVTEIAANAPSTIEELARTRAIGGNIAKGALGSAILAAVARGLAVPNEKCPSPPMKPDLPRGIVPVVDLLKVLLKMKCEAHHVAPKLIASVKDLEQIAADDEAPVPALRGWRRELFGADALALKSGQLALSVASRRLELVPLTTAQVPGAPGRPKGRRSRS